MYSDASHPKEELSVSTFMLVAPYIFHSFFLNREDIKELQGESLEDEEQGLSAALKENGKREDGIEKCTSICK